MLPNEKTLLQVKRSPMALARGCFDLFLTLLMISFALRALAETPFWDDWWLVEQYRALATRFLWEGAGIPAVWIAVALGLVGLFFAVDAWSRLSREISTRYEMTNLRACARWGLLGKTRQDLYLLSIDGVTLEQSVFGRLLGWGHLSLSGRGSNQLDWRFVRKPEEVRDQLDKQVLARRMKASLAQQKTAP